jgi:hypothetical protein
MEIPHYAYLLLKILGPHGVISIWGDVTHTYDCDRERSEITDRHRTSAKLQELKNALAESTLSRSRPRSRPLSHPSG